MIDFESELFGHKQSVANGGFWISWRPMFVYRMILVAVLTAEAVPAMGLCLSGHPSLVAETASVPLVVTARIEQQRDMFEDVADPKGVTATVYTARITDWVKGESPAHIEIYSENTSSRFPMDLKSEYVLWLLKDGARYFVDGCGNSTNLSGNAAVLEHLKRVQQQRHEARGD